MNGDLTLGPRSFAGSSQSGGSSHLDILGTTRVMGDAEKNHFGNQIWNLAFPPQIAALPRPIVGSVHSGNSSSGNQGKQK